MKIIIIVSAVVVIVVLLILFSAVRISCDAVLNNFNAEINLKIKFLTFFEINYNPYGNKKKKGKKNSEKKITFKDLKKKKGSIFKAISFLCDILKNTVKIDYFETDITIALEDPMSTGLVYSAVVSSSNIFYKTLNMRECYLDIRHDFDSGSGIIIKHKSNISIRPIKILAAYFKYMSANCRT